MTYLPLRSLSEPPDSPLMAEWPNKAMNAFPHSWCVCDEERGWWIRSRFEEQELDAVRSGGYAFQIEMSFRAWKKGFRIVEIPIIFHDRVEGQSKMNKRIVREAIWMVPWLRLQAILGRLK